MGLIEYLDVNETENSLIALREKWVNTTHIPLTFQDNLINYTFGDRSNEHSRHNSEFSAFSSS